MKCARTLCHVYWADEGDAAVRWLIGHLELEDPRARQRLRAMPLPAIHEWAVHNRQFALADVCAMARAGATDATVLMDPDLGPNDRLPALVGAAVIARAELDAATTLVRVDGHTAVFASTTADGGTHTLEIGPRLIACTPDGTSAAIARLAGRRWPGSHGADWLELCVQSVRADVIALNRLQGIAPDALDSLVCVSVADRELVLDGNPPTKYRLGPDKKLLVDDVPGTGVLTAADLATVFAGY